MTCPVCLEPIDTLGVVTKCNHKFHTECLITTLEHGHTTCPMCRSQFYIDDVYYTFMNCDHKRMVIGFHLVLILFELIDLPVFRYNELVFYNMMFIRSMVYYFYILYITKFANEEVFVWYFYTFATIAFMILLTFFKTFLYRWDDFLAYTVINYINLVWYNYCMINNYALHGVLTCLIVGVLLNRSL